MTINDAMKALAESLGWKFQDWIDLDGNSIRRLFNPENQLVKWAYLIGDRTVFLRLNEEGAHMADINLHDSLPDFLHSEDASAMLLDAMPAAQLYWIKPHKLWCCVSDCWEHGHCYKKSEHDDRKTAVFLAALAWKDIERPEGL